MAKETLRALHIIVKGRVQGVGFRYWTRSLANSLNVKGRVRNLADYSVEIIAEAAIPILWENSFMLSSMSILMPVLKA